jgi:cupin fold WbuC family metalloprotein
MKVAVFYNHDEIVEVGRDWLEELKHRAYVADQKRARLCLHHSPDDVLHEMIIVFHVDTVIRPHRHLRKTESFHVIFGELDVVLFDEEGNVTRIVEMGDAASGKTQVYRLSGPAWHSVIIRSEYAGIHEVTNGPFRAEENDFAPWAPEEPEALRAFLAHKLGVDRVPMGGGRLPAAAVNASAR